MKAAGRMGSCFIGLERRELGCMRDDNWPSLSSLVIGRYGLKGHGNCLKGYFQGREKGALYKFGGASSNGCTPG